MSSACPILSSILALALLAPGADKPAPPNRPKVPGKMQLTLRYREDGTGALERTAQWEVSETAIIICDMWDDLYCKLAVSRINAMAPKMNRVLSATRAHGAQIIHAPSGTMDVYEGTPYRRRMQLAPMAKPPVPIEKWCYLDPSVEAEMPVDVSNGPCDDPVVGKRVAVYTKENPQLEIIGYDGVSDRGQEIYNFCVQNGIKVIAIMGVHTNMCVLGRPFGIRQMTRLGMNVVLVRDLTDAMYDPRDPPYVSHTRGTEMVIEHVERYWCPSILSADLTRVMPGSADPPKTPR